MRKFRGLLLACAAGALLAVLPSAPAGADDVGTVVVSIYYVAPGKQVDFLKWAAEQDALTREAGLPATQWYAHQDGDAWDYLGVSPATTPDQEKKLEEVAKKHGQKTGMAAGIAMRQYIRAHTDTYAYGPTTAAGILHKVTQ